MKAVIHLVVVLVYMALEVDLNREMAVVVVVVDEKREKMRSVEVGLKMVSLCVDRAEHHESNTRHSYWEKQ